MAAATAPTAGCTGVNAPETGDTVTETSTAESHERQLQISATDSVPSDVPLEPTVEVVRREFTVENTAQIRVSLTNVTASPVWNSTVQIPAFSQFVTEEGPEDHQLILLDPADQYPTVSPGCWRLDVDDIGRKNLHGDVVTDTRYQPGEKRATTFDVYGYPEDSELCLQPGDYRIEDTYHVSTDDERGSLDREYDWGFTIEIANS